MIGDWTFFSNYGHVLVCLARNRQARLRDVAEDVGITERAVQKIVRDLQDAGYLTITKQGRCNRYAINKRKSLRHGLESHCTVGRLLTLLAAPTGRAVQVSDSEATDAAAPQVETGPDAPADPAGAPASPSSGEISPAAASEQTEDRKAPGRKKDRREPGPVDVRQQGSLF